ncbi:MAG TPA: GNAT family N-acetyltransferase [Candidatus Cryosericum sp.]|nr:GNAT family N-acetyltransferase [Candidatus Cryosericum sp.]
MTNCSIRRAREADAQALLDIYAPYVTDTPVTFEYEVPSLVEFASRIRNVSAEYPYLVCEIGGTIVGYAYAHRYKERAAYQWDAELSVYLDGANRGRGLGKVFYTALIEILALQNGKNVYGCVLCPNEGSERLHESLGFSRVGVFRSTGYKCGAWRDVVWFEKQIAPYELEPEPFCSIQALDGEAIDRVLRRAEEALNTK